MIFWLKITLIIVIITLIFYAWRKELLQFLRSKRSVIGVTSPEKGENEPKSYNLNRVLIDYTKPSEGHSEGVQNDDSDIPLGLKFLQDFQKLNKKSN